MLPYLYVYYVYLELFYTDMEQLYIRKPLRTGVILCAVAGLFAIAVLTACSKDRETAQNTKTISGSAQKGPFLNGTSITVYELDQNYTQTGNTFSAVITDNTGSFQINNAALTSNFISIRADGFYFNEVCGSNSISQLTLFGIADISYATSLHVNILTHLEKPRVEYLLGTGMPFDSAKKVAQADVLNIFNISASGIQNSEYLDISDAGDGNAILLAISAILQGFRTESELSSLLSLIGGDIRSDGVINDTAAMSSIIDHAVLLDTASIRANITSYYLNLGITPAIPSFEYYIQQFIANSSFPLTNAVITYPATGMYGDNILVKSGLVFNGSSFSMKAGLKRCSQLKIRLHLISGSVWYYSMNTAGNWNIGSYDYTTQDQFFTVINSEQPSDLEITFQTGRTYLVEYFETNLSTVSFSKTITVN